MSTHYRPTNTDELVQWMTREDEESEGGKKTQRTQRQEWAAHVDAVTLAVTTASKVRKTYRNHLVRFVLFLYNMTCNSSEVDDRSIEGENSDEESEEEGIPKEDFDILHDRLKAAIEAVPFPEITGRVTPRKKELAKLAKERNVKKAIFRELEKASLSYRPIDLERLTPRVFLHHLLKLTKSIEKKEYLKSYGGHRSALMMLFNDCGATRTELFNQELTKVMKGLKNTSAIFRGAQGARLTEGKDPLPFVVYQKICQWLLEKGDKSSIFAHCFLTLTWNLMCRSINTTLVCRDHMSWEGDAVGIQFAHSKTDTTGTQAAYGVHSSCVC